MTQVFSGGTWASSRSQASCKSERSPVKVRNCFGRAWRLRGQNRVPPPPAMIIAWSIRPLRGKYEIRSTKVETGSPVASLVFFRISNFVLRIFLVQVCRSCDLEPRGKLGLQFVGVEGEERRHLDRVAARR